LIKTRVITGALLGVALVATVLFLPTQLMAAIFGVLWVIGAWEWAGLARLGATARLVYAAACAAGMVAALLWAGPDAALAILGVALVWWVLAFLAVVTYPRKFAMSTVAIVGIVVLLPSWLLLVRLHGSGGSLGHGLAMTVLAIVWAADVGAYTFGRWLGRVKLAPAVSPGKTWEGVSGGVLAAAAVSWAAALWLGLPMGAMVVVGIATALVSVVGDLAVSVFKRNVGLKDTGTLLPGHGGVMDRIDSLTAAIPVFVLGIRAAGLVG
jgi:phosphatidate cytidylyltransferase